MPEPTDIGRSTSGRPSNATADGGIVTVTVLTNDGQVINGLKVSETPEEVVIRTAEAIDRRIPQDEIEAIKKSEKSIMPENLHHTFDQKGLVDIVEYMTSLTKK